MDIYNQPVCLRRMMRNLDALSRIITVEQRNGKSAK